MKKYHYTYWLSASPTENYIGCRSCNCKPEDDTAYMSSSNTVKEMIAAGRQFHKHILKVWPTRKEAVAHEILMHRVLDVARNPLFLNKARQKSTGFDTTGKQHSETTREKIGAASRNRTPETLAKMSAAARNRSPETRAKMSAAQTGKKHSAKTRAKMSTSHKGDKNPMYGKTGDKHPVHGRKHTAETRAKISAAQKGENNSMYGKKLSAETRVKISARNKGKTHTPETRAKLSAVLKGKKRSAETRAKISASKKGEKHPMAQAVYDNKTGTTYPTRKAAAEAVGKSTMYIHYHPERFIYERRKIKKNSK